VRDSRHYADDVSTDDDPHVDAVRDDVTIRLSHDEAVVLFELLHRWEEHGQVAQPEYRAEQVALWNLSSLLESVLVDPFDPAYGSLVANARTRLAVEQQSPPESP
jgi:hypothetical protein